MSAHIDINKKYPNETQEDLTNTAGNLLDTHRIRPHKTFEFEPLNFQILKLFPRSRQYSLFYQLGKTFKFQKVKGQRSKVAKMHMTMTNLGQIIPKSS